MKPISAALTAGSIVTLALASSLTAGEGDDSTHVGAPASGSLLADALQQRGAGQLTADASLFRIVPPEPRTFQHHDLIQIIVRENSSAASTHDLETKKKYDIGGTIDAWPHLDLSDILQLQLKAGNTPQSELPAVDISLDKHFKGEGDYEREDDFTARLTAEVVEVMPNGNLILEARTTIVNDKEESTISVTGVCRPADVTAANSVLSNQIHDLRISKHNAGELKKANDKGVIAHVFDFLFAW